MQSDDYKLLHDFNIFTDKRISARRPDIVCVDKCSGCGTFIDVTCVMDRHVIDKQRKTEKYLDLATESQNLWNVRFEVIPLVFGALGTLHETTIKSFKSLQLSAINVCQLMKTVLLKTAAILRGPLGLPSSRVMYLFY